MSQIRQQFLDRIIVNEMPISSNLSFIDRIEIEEMLAEYYNFDKVTEEMWVKLDYEIMKLCSERGVSPNYAEDYARICDTCCEKLSFPSLRHNPL